MGRSSPFPSLLCAQICTFVLINTIWNSKLDTISLIPETLETCGIFLHDFQPSSCNQKDVLHDIIEHLQLKQQRPQSLIIQNELSQEEIQLDIFSSMKYDCYFHVHLKFGKDLFSTIPSIKTPLESALYQKGLFLIYVQSNPYKMVTVAKWELQFERQHRIFVFRIYRTLHRKNNQLRAKPFDLLIVYFFCTFC